MQEGKLKNWIMIGLLGTIIIVLLTQPIVVTQMTTSAWVTADERFSIGEAEIIDGEEDSYLSQYLPSADGNIIAWEERNATSSAIMHIRYRDMDTGEIYFVNNADPVYQSMSDVDDGRIVWAEHDGDNYFNIFMIDLETDQISHITNDSLVNYRPRIAGDYIVYIKQNSYGRIAIYNLNNATETVIEGTNTSQSLEFDGDTIVFTDHEDNLLYYDLSDAEIVDTGIDAVSAPFVEGEMITYARYDYDVDEWLGGYYDIERNRDYTFEAEGMQWGAVIGSYENNIFGMAAYPDVSDAYQQIFIIPDYQEQVIFNETQSKITNDAYFKGNGVVTGEYIIWQQFQAFSPTKASGIYEHDIMFVTYETYTAEEIPRDFEEQTVYNYDVIYTIILLSCTLGAVVALWLNEHWSDYKYGI